MFPTTDDGEILDRLREGDTSAFDSVFRSCYPSLVRLATRMLRDPAVAEEIVQDVMLELWRRRDRLAASDVDPDRPASIPGVAVGSLNPDLALPLCYISAALIGILGLVAVGYNLRISMTRRPKAA